MHSANKKIVYQEGVMKIDIHVCFNGKYKILKFGVNK